MAQWGLVPCTSREGEGTVLAARVAMLCLTHMPHWSPVCACGDAMALAISSHPRAGAGVGRSFVCSHSAARGDQRYSQDWERVPVVTCDRAVSGDRWVA